jgi:hypothetical protein
MEGAKVGKVKTRRRRENNKNLRIKEVDKEETMKVGRGAMKREEMNKDDERNRIKLMFHVISIPVLLRKPIL